MYVDYASRICNVGLFLALLCDIIFFTFFSRFFLFFCFFGAQLKKRGGFFFFLLFSSTIIILTRLKCYYVMYILHLPCGVPALFIYLILLCFVSLCRWVCVVECVCMYVLYGSNQKKKKKRLHMINLTKLVKLTGKTKR